MTQINLKRFNQLLQSKGYPIRLVVFSLLILTLFSCANKKTHPIDAGPKGPVDWSQVKPAIPKQETPSRYGNPKSYEVFGEIYHVLPSAKNFKQKGVASWYGSNFHGRRTSSGETYDMLKMTAAHKTLPIPCYVKVTNHDNGREIIVRVNDRGPFLKSRIIDLSYAAAYKLGMAEKGVANVSIETISFTENPSTKAKIKPLVVASNQPSIKKKIFVQVGAYSSRQRADTLQKILAREIDLPVKISVTQRAGKKLYRVRIGPIDDRAVAERLVETINQTELGKPRIVYQD